MGTTKDGRTVVLGYLSDDDFFLYFTQPKPSVPEDAASAERGPENSNDAR
jgi:hypothetical protein